MDQETLDVPQTPQPAVTDACGCTPHMPTMGGSPVAATDLPGAPARTTENPPVDEASRRTLKLVLTLAPAEAGHYRAALAIGAEGCDPLLHSMRVSALVDALEQVPTLVDEAEAHWRLYPRNPTSVRAPSQQPGPKRGRVSSSPLVSMATEPPPEIPSDVQVEGEPIPMPATAPVTAPTRPTGGQLTLFG